MKTNIIFLVTAAMMIIFTSCGSTKKIQTAIAKIDTVAVLPVVASTDNHAKEDSASFIKENFNRVENNRIGFTTFSAKIDVNYEDGDGKQNNVTAHVRMYRDSVIWLSITGILGFEGIRAYITSDSVKWIDKQNKVFTKRSVSYLQELTDLPLDLSSLQDLLVGNPVFFDSTISSYSRGVNSISLFSVGDFFRNLLTIGETDKLLQSSKLDDMDEQRNRTCHLGYTDYENKKGYNFSTHRNISVAEKKQMDIKLDFRQYDFNETLSFPFNIPKNYKLN